MSPTSRKVLRTTSYLTGGLNSNFGEKNTVAMIRGSVKKLGLSYQNSMVVLFNKISLLPLIAKKTDINGDYAFHGLNTNLRVFIVAFDQKQQFNAVIQDNVVPK